MRLLALTGSLRATSINTELLRAAAILLPSGVTLVFSAQMGALPHFNPDLDQEGMLPVDAVATLRSEIAAADALLISCPEYAHGVAGAFKNLLDWLVSGPEMPGKPVCVLSASSSARFGPASLVETLRTMSCIVVRGAPVLVPIDGRRLDAAAIARDEALAGAIGSAIRELQEIVTQRGY